MNAPATTPPARTAAAVMEAINRWPYQTFEYGTSDCCQFAAFVARELTGVDHAATFEYASEAEAQEIQRRAGGLTGALTAIFGEPMPVAALLPGDPVLIRWRDLEVVAVVIGAGRAAAPDVHGHILEVPLRLACYGWSL